MLLDIHTSQPGAFNNGEDIMIVVVQDGRNHKFADRTTRNLRSMGLSAVVESAQKPHFVVETVLDASIDAVLLEINPDNFRNTAQKIADAICRGA